MAANSNRPTIPTDHELRAALRTARLIDIAGNTVEDARATYRITLSQGEHRALDLQVGEELLRSLDLIEVSTSGRVNISARLSIVASLGDEDALDFFRRAFRRIRDEGGPGEVVDRIQIGNAGEEAVVLYCQQELESLGRPDLVAGVQQVSLLDDSLGYDVIGPTLAGPPRHIEVKTTRSNTSSIFRFFLSRNEFDVGMHKLSSWSLVACTWPHGGDPIPIGWCRASAIRPYLPEDRNGRWTEALVSMPLSALFEGLPSGV